MQLKFQPPFYSVTKTFHVFFHNCSMWEYYHTISPFKKASHVTYDDIISRHAVLDLRLLKATENDDAPYFQIPNGFIRG